MKTVVRIERHSAEFDIHSHFPGASEFHLGEGETVYLAELNGMFYVVVDSRAVLDLLADDEKEDLEDASVSVYEFPSKQGRSEYLASRNINRNVE